MTTIEDAGAAHPEAQQPGDELSNHIHAASFVGRDEQARGYVFALEAPHQEERAWVSFEELGQAPELEPGQAVRLLIERAGPAGWSASLRKAQRLDQWERLVQMAQDREVVEGLVLSQSRAGVAVDVGVRAFAPRQQLDLSPVEDASAYVGQRMAFVVTAFDQERAELILSRRALLERERARAARELKQTLAVGATLEGVVRALKPYGAFVDVGGLEGLLHISQLSWGRVEHPSEVLQVGDVVQVVVLEYEPKKRRLALGRKQLMADPWVQVAPGLSVADVLEGQVVHLAEFGAFVAVAPGLEGLVHVSELSWTERVTHPRQVVSVGQQVQVKVLQLDLEARRLALSLRQVTEDPWSLAAAALQVADVVQGHVRGITDFGVFVEVAAGVQGLVHVSDVSWTEEPGPLSARFKVDEAVTVKVLSVDAAQRRIALGIKQLTSDPWQEAAQRAVVGAKIEVEITRLTKFGAFAAIVEGVEGLIHVSELAEDRVEQVQHVVRPGQRVQALVLAFDRGQKRISLSLKRDSLDEQPIHSYDEGSQATSTLGTLLREQLGSE